jgi:hypothetical protein
MRSIRREDVPVVIDDNGVEVRLRDEDGLTASIDRGWRYYKEPRWV